MFLLFFVLSYYVKKCDEKVLKFVIEFDIINLRLNVKR